MSTASTRQSSFATVARWYYFILAALVLVTQLQCDADLVVVELQLCHKTGCILLSML